MSKHDVMRRLVLEGETSEEVVTTEDGGQAKVVEFDLNATGPLFVRVHSWDPSKKHDQFNTLIGKKIRITIEEIP